MCKFILIFLSCCYIHAAAQPMQFLTRKRTAIDTNLIVWTNVQNTVDAGSGTLNGINSTLPAGATATKKIVGDGYLEAKITASASGLLLVIYSSNDGNYTFPGTSTADIYSYNGNIYKYINSNIGPIGSYAWIRMRIIGNDVYYQASVDGISYDTLESDIGVLSGITNRYIKAVFASNSTSQSLQSVRGSGLQ